MEKNELEGIGMTFNAGGRWQMGWSRKASQWGDICPEAGIRAILRSGGTCAGRGIELVQSPESRGG